MNDDGHFGLITRSVLECESLSINTITKRVSVEN